MWKVLLLWQSSRTLRGTDILWLDFELDPEIEGTPTLSLYVPSRVTHFIVHLTS